MRPILRFLPGYPARHIRGRGQHPAYLNERLLNEGGHGGDGIRPGERGKGYGVRMIALALEECRKLGINEVSMCRDKVNIASARTIIKNGGVLENEITVNGMAVQRYWIRL